MPARFPAVDAGHTAFLYPYAGSLRWATRPHPARPPGRRAVGGRAHRGRRPAPSAASCCSPPALGEPVVQYGPFVMNTREEIEQALADYRDGTLA
jgi:redox-sensitive bicupin YhaK (pirin superfamily)